MGNRTSSSKNNSAQSFWSTLPGILTAVAAVITAVGGLIAALAAAGVFTPRSRPAPSGVTNPISISAFSSSGQNSQSSIPAGCFDRFFQAVAKDRIFSLEVGADSHIIGLDQINDQPIGIVFENNGSPVGGIIFKYFPDGQLFRVSSVVDANCTLIATYSNVSRGGDQNVLQNWDDLQIRLGNATYALSLGFDGSSIQTVFK